MDYSLTLSCIVQLLVGDSVTIFGEISPLWLKSKSLGQVGLLSARLNFHPTLAIYFSLNGQILKKLSSRLVTLVGDHLHFLTHSSNRFNLPTRPLFKWTNPGLLFVFYADRRSRRVARWPLDRHHGQHFTEKFTVNLEASELGSSEYILPMFILKRNREKTIETLKGRRQDWIPKMCECFRSFQTNNTKFTTN